MLFELQHIIRNIKNGWNFTYILNISYICDNYYGEVFPDGLFTQIIDYHLHSKEVELYERD